MSRSTIWILMFLILALFWSLVVASACKAVTHHYNGSPTGAAIKFMVNMRH